MEGGIRQVWVGGVINQLWGWSSAKYGGVISQVWGAISQVWGVINQLWGGPSAKYGGVSIFPPVCTGTQNPENYFSNTYVLPSVNRTAEPIKPMAHCNLKQLLATICHKNTYFQMERFTYT